MLPSPTASTVISIRKAAWLVALGLIILGWAYTAPVDAGPAETQRLQQLIDGPQRTPANRERDRYRSPLAVLEFCK